MATISVVQPTGGTITPSIMTCSEGDYLTFSLSINSGYIFDSWIIDGTRYQDLESKTGFDPYVTTSGYYRFGINGYKDGMISTLSAALKAETQDEELIFITSQPTGASISPTSASFHEGDTIALSCKINNSGYLFQYWTFNGTPISENSHYSMTYNGEYYILTIYNATADDAGVYSVATMKEQEGEEAEPDTSIDESLYSNLYFDSSGTKILYPKTKAGAITLEDGTNLESLLTQLKMLL